MLNALFLVRMKRSLGDCSKRRVDYLQFQNLPSLVLSLERLQWCMNLPGIGWYRRFPKIHVMRAPGHSIWISAQLLLVGILLLSCQLIFPSFHQRYEETGIK